MSPPGPAAAGLTSAEAARRLRETGPNVLRSHRAEGGRVLVNQFRSGILLLLLAAACLALAVGQGPEAVIVLTIVGASVLLGFLNEYRSERAVEALQSRIRRTALVTRDGRTRPVDVTALVPGDVVTLGVGDVVPADLRLVAADGLECDESVLTGEPLAVAKSAAPDAPDSPEAASSRALMGTVVRAGGGRGIVEGTGARTTFGRIAMRLGERHEQTAFQLGLRDFTGLLVRLGALLSATVFVVNVALGRGWLESGLFALAIAIGLTPQLLPAIVTVSLSVGARRLAAHRVIVKRLVCIEDLGNVEVLFTDKTGTLTEGRITLRAALGPSGDASASVVPLGLACNEAVIEDGAPVGGNALDRALWRSAGEQDPRAAWRRVAVLPFDHERQMGSVLADAPAGGRSLVVKGAPEAVLARCRRVPAEARTTLATLFDAGSRVIAVATRPADGAITIARDDEHDLELAGYLVFDDPPRPDVAASVARLHRLGVAVKVVTGDNARVAEALCDRHGIPRTGTLTGAEIAAMDDERLRSALATTSVFARVTPEQKARIVRCQRSGGSAVGFLGDGVNDVLALHDADVGISVESATDVARDAADVVLVEKDLGILAQGVTEGRRIFANTIKYVLMGTSSNFGNMLSAAAASLVLDFLPMTPGQILLNNLLYDTSELTIPTDHVDEELLARPAQWDVRFIRRFLGVFGPVSSIYDVLTFTVMITVFHADDELFHSGWFVESLATQTLVILAIRTRRVPFWRSRPSAPLLITTLACVAVGVVLPYTALGGAIGFTPLPPAFLAVLAAMVVAYIALVELVKRRFYRPAAGGRPLAPPGRRPSRRVHRVAARWSHAEAAARPGA